MFIIIGSCTRSDWGIGTIVKGLSYRYDKDKGYEIWTGDEWVECYDVVFVYADGTVEQASPAL